MFCPKCGKETPDHAKFCINCGFPVEEFLKEQNSAGGGAAPSPGAVFQADAGTDGQSARRPAPSRSGRAPGKGPLPLILGAAAVLLVLILVLVNVLKPKYEVNDASLAPVTPIAGYTAASSEDLSVSFLYPSGASLRDNGKNGIYVYTSGTQGLPYIQITKVKGKQDPDKYFKDYKKQTEKEYGGAKLDDPVKVPVSKKTLYMQRAYVFRDGADQILDRYIEIYPSETVEYTVKSLAARSEDPALAAVIESLRPGTDVYGGSGIFAGGSGSSSGGETPVPPQPAPTSPAPTSPAPTEPPATIPAPTQPAPTEPPATIPAPTQPAPTEPPATIPAPTQGAPSGGGSSGSSSGSSTRLTGQDVAGMDGFQIFMSYNAGFGIMCNMQLVDSVWEVDGGMHVRLKALADDEDCDIVIRKNDFRSDGITTKEQFLEAYIDSMIESGAARPQIYDLGGGTLQFKGITENYNEEGVEFSMYLFAADDGSGNIYTIYFDAWPEEVNLYTEVVNGLFATLTPM